jgi:hypothetical protein
MKKLTDYLISSINRKLSRYAKQVEKFPSNNYHPDSKEGKKLWNIYFRLLSLENKTICSDEVNEKNNSLCGKVLKKFQKIV